MVFTSLEFLFIFLPIVLAVCFILPKKIRNYWLLIVSLIFYMFGEGQLVLLMIGSIVFNYIMALLIEKCRNIKGFDLSRIFLVFDIAGNVIVLFILKYMNFTTGLLSKLFPESITVTNIILPLGISFFTFQAMSYVIDVYRGTKAQINPAKVGLYISLFPQLVAGPIIRYSDIEHQINERKITYVSFSSGVLRFIRGFNKKVLIANGIAELADFAWQTPDRTVLAAWLGAIAYAIQIFFDFAGYSDMAIGLGHMFGFEFPENFNYPYISKTISEFWRRWHISLGSWFRDYVYIPLGGSKVDSKWRVVFNLAVVWLITGIWHGANWTFILWGAGYGILIIFEKLFNTETRMKSWNNGKTILYQIATLLMVCFGWVVFRSESLEVAFGYFGSMFGLMDNAFADKRTLFMFKESIVILIAGIIGSMPVFKYIREKMQPKVQSIWDNITYAVQFLLFIVSVSFLIIGEHNPFIYFNF